MKKTIRNLNITWLLAILFSTVSVQSMEFNRDVIIRGVLSGILGLSGGILADVAGKPALILPLNIAGMTLVIGVEALRAYYVQQKKHEQHTLLISRIQSLPEEVKIHIIDCLSSQEKNILMQVCKDSHAWFKNNRTALLLANPSDYANNILYSVSRDGDITMVKLAIKLGAHVNRQNSQFPYQTPLHVASEHNRIDVAKALIDAQANINQTDGRGLHGDTPLHIASANGHIKIVKLLIAAGADVNKYGREQYGSTPLDYAARRGHTEIAKLLIAAGAHETAMYTYYLKLWKEKSKLSPKKR